MDIYNQDYKYGIYELVECSCTNKISCKDKLHLKCMGAFKNIEDDENKIKYLEKITGLTTFFISGKPFHILNSHDT